MGKGKWGGARDRGRGRHVSALSSKRSNRRDGGTHGPEGSGLDTGAGRAARGGADRAAWPVPVPLADRRSGTAQFRREFLRSGRPGDQCARSSGQHRTSVAGQGTDRPLDPPVRRYAVRLAGDERTVRCRRPFLAGDGCELDAAQRPGGGPGGRVRIAWAASVRDGAGGDARHLPRRLSSAWLLDDRGGGPGGPGQSQADRAGRPVLRGSPPPANGARSRWSRRSFCC